MKSRWCVAMWMMAMFPAVLVSADELARLAPADTRVFIALYNLADHRAEWDADPLAQMLRENFPDGPELEEWRILQQTIGMTRQQILDTFFGRAVALVGSRPGAGQPLMAFSRIAPADGQMLIERLQLHRTGNAGDFTTYGTPDRKAIFAFHDEWMVISSIKHDDYMRRVLTGIGEAPSLAQDDTFLAWTDRLPRDRTATMFIRNEGAEQLHALGVVKRDRLTTVHYVGRSPQHRDIYRRLHNGAFSFGPMPRATLAAVALNFYDPRQGGRSKPFVDQLLAPKTLRGDVLPALEAPVVMFLGEVPGHQIDPDPGLSLPVFGLAIKMRDPAIAQDISRAMNSGATMLGVMAATQGNDPPIGARSITHAGTTFHVADIGVMLATRAEREELKPMDLAYGQIGDWYVICTQEMFFRRAISSRDGDFSPPDRAPQNMQPVARIHIQPVAFGNHLFQLTQHLNAEPWQGLDPRVLQHMQTFGRAMTYYRSIDMTFHRDEDDAMVGKLELVRD